MTFVSQEVKGWGSSENTFKGKASEGNTLPVSAESTILC